MLLGVPQSVLVLLPSINMRGPILPASIADCLNHIVTAKLVTFPKPRLTLVMATKFPLTPWVKLDDRFKARLPVVNPATPEFAEPCRLVTPPVLLIICKVTSTPPPLVSLGVVVP